MALYVESVLLTDVARALILFYAMPAWGTILEVAVMRRPLTRWRLLSLVLSVVGLLIIIGLGSETMGAMNLGDVMALLSGILFAFGAMVVRQESEASVFEQILAFFLYGGVAALVLSMLPFAALGTPPAGRDLLMLVPWLLLAAVASPQASLGYLKRALQVNPNSPRARKGMEWAMKRLGSAPVDQTQPTRASKPRTTSPPKKRSRFYPVLLKRCAIEAGW